MGALAILTAASVGMVAHERTPDNVDLTRWPLQDYQPEDLSAIPVSSTSPLHS